MSKLYIMQAVSSSNGQLYTWNSNTPDFSAIDYPGPGSPQNVALADSHYKNFLINKHDTTHSPLGLWQFDGNLNDSSGNGRNLAVNIGTAKYTQPYPGLNGIWFDGLTRLTNSSSVFRILGDLTIEMFLWINDYTVSSVLLACNGNGDAENANFAYQLSSGGADGLLALFWESGAGVDRQYILDGYTAPRKTLIHYAVVRASNIIRFYMDGRQCGADSPVQIAPTGATISTLAVGNSNVTGNPLFPATNVWISSLKIMDTALTSTQIAAECNRTLGKRFPNV